MGRHAAPERGEILRRGVRGRHRPARRPRPAHAPWKWASRSPSRGPRSPLAGFFRWYSEEAVRIAGDYRVAPAGGSRHGGDATAGRPRAPMIRPGTSPWRRDAQDRPGRRAGCTMVLKPATLTPRSPRWRSRILIDAGLPPASSTHVITTSEPGPPRDLSSQTPGCARCRSAGSTEVGKQLIQASAEQVSSPWNSAATPFLVFADADLDAAVDGAMLARNAQQGRSVHLRNRFLVEAPRRRGVRRPPGKRIGSLNVGAQHWRGRRRPAAHRRPPARHRGPPG